MTQTDIRLDMCVEFYDFFDTTKDSFYTDEKLSKKLKRQFQQKDRQRSTRKEMNKFRFFIWFFPGFW